MKNRVELRDYIRFQLAQLSKRNGEHEFEQLCFALARLRHVSNVQPATGPVQAGGDQGRDFESYRSYLRSSSIASSAFLSLVSSDMVAGACTMEKRDTAAKVRSDLAVIFGSGVRPNAVIYFCEADVPVARRHKLQEECSTTYGAELSLQDGAAIADQLADPDTFWIAEQYLLVPADMFPSDVGDADYHERRTRWLDERTRRIEAKLDGLVKDEEAVGAEHRWAYIQNNPIRRMAFFFVLKGEVGLEWFRGILNETRLSFAKDDARWSLGTLLDASGPPNTEKRSEEADRAVSAFWEMYGHAPGYWVRRTDRTPRHFSVVSGFDVTAPWSLVGVPEVTKLADLASLNEIHLSIPPAAYLPGIEDFVIDFISDTFAFSVALSDHGLDVLHRMAHTFRALGGEVEIGSFGTGFSGVQLLELFRDQLGPSPKNPRKGFSPLGLSGPEDRGIAFYPKMPPDFRESPEADNYDHTVTLSGVQEIDLEDQVKELEEQIATQPSDPKPYAELAARYARQGRITDSIRWLEKAIANATPDAMIHGLLGEALMEIGRHDEAVESLRSAIAIEETTDRLLSLGNAFVHLSRWSDAQIAFQRALELGAAGPDIKYALAAVMVNQNKLTEAKTVLEELVKEAPDHGLARKLLGDLDQ